MNGKSFVLFFSCLAVAVALFLIGNDAGWFRSQHPPIFDTHPEFHSARAAAEAADRILVVDMTASWCPPCREMDRSVWVDAALEAYLTGNAVAVQIDVDEHPELAGEFGIEFLPTIIVLDVKRRLELDRRSSLIEAPELINWFKALDQSRHLLPPATPPPTPPSPTPADQPDDQ